MNTQKIVPWLLLACLVVTGLYGWPDPQNIQVPAGAMLGWDNASGSWKPVAINGQGVMQSGVTIASLTISPSGSMQTYDIPLATSTVTNILCVSTPSVITPVASRAYVLFQNQAATESAYMYPGLQATPGLGIEIQAGDSVLRPWGSSVKCSVTSTDSLNLVVEQGVMP